MITPVGGDHPKRDAHQQRDDQRVEGQFQGGCAVGGQHFRDFAVVRQCGSEVAGDKLAQVFEVLHQNGPVITGGVDALLQLIGGKPAAEGRRDGISGDPHQEEHHGHQDEDGGKDQEEPDQDVLAQSPAGLLFL
ncbi:MAG: hypothetical protein K0R37_1859 [Arthrobacter sp.]|nr:hypothetical protein [Arthrobacter sp.]